MIRRREDWFINALEYFRVLKSLLPTAEILDKSENFQAQLDDIDERMRYILEKSRKLNQFLQMPLTEAIHASIRCHLISVRNASRNVYVCCILISRSFHGMTLKLVVLETVHSFFGILEELYNKYFEEYKNPEMMVDCHQLMENLLAVINKVLSLPKDNKVAVLMRMEEVSRSVLNAQTELNEAVAEKAIRGMTESRSGQNCDVIDEFDETDKFSVTWKTAELDVAKNALDAIKTFQNYLCNTREAIEHNCPVLLPSDTKDRDCPILCPDIKEILIKITDSDKGEYRFDYLENFSNITTQLDAAMLLAQMCCTSVQDLVSLLRPPTRDVEAARDTVCLLNQLLTDFLKLSKYITT